MIRLRDPQVVAMVSIRYPFRFGTRLSIGIPVHWYRMPVRSLSFHVGPVCRIRKQKRVSLLLHRSERVVGRNRPAEPHISYNRSGLKRTNQGSQRGGF